MSDIVKGEVVESTFRGYAHEIRANKHGRHEAQWIEIGTELLVTSPGREYLNVRYVDKHMPRGAFRVHRSNVQRVRQIGEPPAGAILPEHPDLAWLWEDAARLATRNGYCDEFDRLTDALGVPGREREFRVPMLSEDGLRITATVTARSRSLAERKIRDRMISATPLELTGGAR